MYVRCPNPKVWQIFWASTQAMHERMETEDRWRALFAGNLVRLLLPEAKLWFKEEAAKAIWVTVDETLDLVAGVPWRDRSMFRLPTSIIGELMGRCNYKPIVSECELTAAVLALLLWELCDGKAGIIILCAGNMNVFHWMDAGNPTTGSLVGFSV